MIKEITAAVALAAGITSSASNVEVAWQNLANRIGADGKAEYVQRFIISGDLKDLSRLAFCQFDRAMKPVNVQDTVARIIPGYYYIASPRFAAGSSIMSNSTITTGFWWKKGPRRRKSTRI